MSDGIDSADERPPGEARNALSNLVRALCANDFGVDAPLVCFRIGAGRVLLSRVDVGTSEIVTEFSDEFPTEQRFVSFAAYFRAAKADATDGCRRKGRFVGPAKTVYSPYNVCDVRFTCT